MLALTGSAAAQPTQDQLARGRDLYKQHCATCHTRGGTAQEPTAEKLASMGTARDLFIFVRFGMPQNAPGSLKEQEYWDILAHLLSETGFLPSGVRLGPETLDGIRLAK